MICLSPFITGSGPSCTLAWRYVREIRRMLLSMHHMIYKRRDDDDDETGDGDNDDDDETGDDDDDDDDDDDVDGDKCDKIIIITVLLFLLISLFMMMKATTKNWIKMRLILIIDYWWLMIDIGIHLDSISKFSESPNLICPSAVNGPPVFFSSSTLLCLAWLNVHRAMTATVGGWGGFVGVVWKLGLMTSTNKVGPYWLVINGVITYYKWPKIRWR